MMLSFFRKWREAKNRNETRKRTLRRFVRPCLETMEERCVPSSTTWTSNSSTDWNTAANWSNGVPISTSFVQFSGTATCKLAADTTVLSVSENWSGKTLDLNGHNLTITGNLSLTAGMISCTGKTLSAGDFDFYGGTIQGSAASVGEVDITGDGVGNDFQFSIDGNLSNALLKVGTSSACTVTESGASAAKNLNITGSSSYIEVESGSTWQLYQHSPSGNGGIIWNPQTDGTTSPYFNDYGSVIRDWSSRSASDHGDSGIVNCNIPMKIFAGGSLTIGDSMQMKITGVSAATGFHNTSLWNNGGTVTLSGGYSSNYSELYLSGNYYQDGTSPLLRALDGNYNAGNDSEIDCTDTTNNNVYIESGYISLPMFNAGSAGTSGANHGTLKIDCGSCFMDGTSGTPAHVEFGVWSDTSGNVAYDQLWVNGAMKGTNASGTETDVTTYGAKYTNGTAYFKIYHMGTSSTFSSSSSTLVSGGAFSLTGFSAETFYLDVF